MAARTKRYLSNGLRSLAKKWRGRCSRFDSMLALFRVISSLAQFVRVAEHDGVIDILAQFLRRAKKTTNS